MRSELLEIDQCHQDAVEFLQRLLHVAEKVLESTEGDWKEIGHVVDATAAALTQVVGITKPIADAIAKERAYQDEMEDRWEAQRL